MNKIKKIIAILLGRDKHEPAKRHKETEKKFNFFSVGMMIFYAIMLANVLNWFMEIEEPTGEHSAVVVALIGAASVFLGLFGVN